jgi:uncharacterized protein YndB with AHSA1/START domain
MRIYHFVTDWSFKAPVNKVWDAIVDVEAYPTWWPGFKKAQIRGTDKTLRIGTVIDVTVKGFLGELNFTLEVRELEMHKKLLFKSSGDLQGTGLWVFEQQNRETRVRYYWDVGTTGLLMNLVGLFAKPWLTRSHEKVMSVGYRVLKSIIEE